MKERKISFVKNKPVKGKDKIIPKTSQNNFKMFMNSAFIAPRGSGKTHALINLLQRLKYENAITEIFIVSPTFDVNPFDVLNVPEKNVFTEVDNVNDILHAIDEHVTDELDLWYGIRSEFSSRKYKKYYELIFKLHKLLGDGVNCFDGDDDDVIKLTDEELLHLELNNYDKNPKYYDKIPSYAIVLDDCMNSKAMSNSKCNIFTRLLCNHRHKHMSFFICCQALKNGLPRSCRSNIMQYFIWKFSNEEVIDELYTEIGNGFSSKEEFHKLYKHCTEEPFSFMCLDANPKNKSLKIRKNFDTIIEI